MRFAIRQLLKRPGFTAVAVLTLALGIGASTAIYSVVDRLFLRPLPVHHPRELVRLGVVPEQSTYYAFSYPFYRDCREQCSAFAALAAYAEMPVSYLAKDEAERIRALLISDNYFETLGLNAALGRLSQSATDNVSGVVLSYRFWQRIFAADPSVIGQTIELNRQHFHVIGVAPAEFAGTVTESEPEVYLPLVAPGLLSAFDRKLGDPLQSRSQSWLNILGRLRPGLTREQGQAAVRALFTAIGTGRHGIEAHQLLLEPGYRGHDSQLRRLKLPVLLVHGAVGLVLFIACVNIANLLLIQATTRRRELAIRLAVGATRARLIRQLLGESLLLAAAGCALGVLLAQWWLTALNSFAPRWGLPALPYAFDLRALTFSVALALLTAILFGLIPAIRAAWSNCLSGLKESETAHSSRLRHFFAVTQVALCVVVLSSALLCLRSVHNLQAIDPGYDGSKVLVVSFDLDQAGYPERSRQVFWTQLLETMRRMPQVEAASLCNTVGIGGNSAGISLGELDGYETKPNESIAFRLDVISPDYFRTLGTVLQGGRDFADRDTADAPSVAIINETMARRFWAGRDPLGMQLHLPRLAAPPPTAGSGTGLPKGTEVVEVVGIVRPWKNERLTGEPQPTMFRPVTQVSLARLSLHLRTRVDPKNLLLAVQREVRALDPYLPLADIRTLAAQKASSLSLQRTTATLLSWFGGAALVLTALGLYGVVAFSVALRTREIGLRMALGAPRAEVFRGTILSGMKLAGCGLAVGLAATLGITWVLRSMLFGISPTDPITLSLVLLMLLLLALLACWLPALRATRIHPMTVLRHE